MASCFARSLWVVALLSVACGAGGDQPECWDEKAGLTFDVCCKNVKNAPGLGDPSCWDGSFNFDLCCPHEVEARVHEGLEVVRRGEYRRASDELFNLMMNYAPGTEYVALAFSGWEKAGKEFRKVLDAEPHSLTYFEVIFRGVGLDCDPIVGQNGSVEVRDPYSEFARCCEPFFFNHTGCNMIQELLTVAIGSGRHRGVPTKMDNYYGNMSEMWGFHHFTPSVLMSSDGHQNAKSPQAINKELNDIFYKQGEPMLGIVWADHIGAASEGSDRGYRSPKFNFGVEFLTRIFDGLRRAGVKTVDMFEIGAGYGSMPRFMASAKKALLDASIPVYVRNYAIMDMRSVIDLQRWYLKKTAGDFIRQSDWSDPSHRCSVQAVHCWRPGGTDGLWALDRIDPQSAQQRAAPLNVDFVDTDKRDVFAHIYADAHTQDESDPSVARVLFAVNSWHEFAMQDFMWHYNTFVAAPTWRMGVDFIFYVSNREWFRNAEKEALMMHPRSVHFVLELEECSPITCIRVFRRVR